MFLWATCCRAPNDDGKINEERIVESEAENCFSGDFAPPTAIGGHRGFFGAAGGTTDMIRLDKEMADLKSKDGMNEEERYQRHKDQASALHEVAAKGTRGELEELLTDPRVKLHINALNMDGETPLHRAAYWGNAEVIVPLLEAHADISIGDKKDKTALRKAYQNAEITRALLGYGADVNATDKHGETILHRAAEEGASDVVAVLLEFGAHIELPNEDGWPAIHSAAEQGHKEVVQVLLQRGARADLKNSEGETPAQCAETAGHTELVRLLQRHGG